MNPLTFPCVAWQGDLPFMRQKKQACKSDRLPVKNHAEARNRPAHDAALYLPLKWHLYLPKLSFDSLPHTVPQITFNADIKSGTKVGLWP